MTNEELKKKIVDIIMNIEWTDIFGIRHGGTADGLNNAIADALIAAGIGDVKEAKKETEYWENEAKTARADIDDAVKEITTRIFRELRNWFADQSAYAVDCNQHLGYYDYEIKASDVVYDIVTIAEKYGVELGVKDDD